MRGLLIVVLVAERARWEGALRLAAAQAALGGRVRLFLDDAAVPLLALADGPDELLTTALELGVELVACQSGLAAAGIDLARVGVEVAGGGLVSVLSTLGEDRLLTI